MFRERIVPRAVLYFTGEALEEDSEFDEEESGDEDDDEDGKFRRFRGGVLPYLCRENLWPLFIYPLQNLCQYVSFLQIKKRFLAFSRYP